MLFTSYPINPYKIKFYVFQDTNTIQTPVGSPRTAQSTTSYMSCKNKFAGIILIIGVVLIITLLVYLSVTSASNRQGEAS